MKNKSYLLSKMQDYKEIIKDINQSLKEQNRNFKPPNKALILRNQKLENIH